MKVIYNDNVLNLSEGTTVEEAREALTPIYPELANAEGVTDANGDITFTVVAGKKG